MSRTGYLLFSRRFCSAFQPTAELIDWDYYGNPSNFNRIFKNVMARKVSCDLVNVANELKKLHETPKTSHEYQTLKEALVPKLMFFPNDTHPRVLDNKTEEPALVKKVGNKTNFSYFPTNFPSLTKRLNVLRTKFLGHISGNKSYYLKGDLAMLEHALVQFAVSKLVRKNFQLISVPDIIPRRWIENCGMRTDGAHSQVYHITSSINDDLCLSGTSEMALGSYVSSQTFDVSSLPLRLCAVSRCFRAEANRHQKEKGIFRVHYFTKVEMFGVSANETGDESELLLREFTDLQEEIFSELGLHFKVCEMAPCDLGLPAYHKYDIEAWIPTQKLYGEISSASNCTDFQSRRLNIKYSTSSNEQKLCHTVNGTAMAIPRMLISIFENFQNLDGSVNVPEPLKPFMKKDVIKDRCIDFMLCTKPTK